MSRLESTLKLLPDLKKRYPKVLFSLDTYKPNIMLHAAKMGVRMINNILGVADPTTMRKLAQFEGMHYLAMNAGGDSVEKYTKRPRVPTPSSQQLGAGFHNFKNPSKRLAFQRTEYGSTLE